MRFFSIVTWLIASLVFASSELAFAQQPTASTAPLSATELEAIIAEARQRINTLGFGMEDPAGPPWKSLTRDQLAKLVASPQLVKAPGMVLDQAFAWDLVKFRNLSDIKRFLKNVYGDRSVLDEKGDLFNSRLYWSLYATAGLEGGALVTIINCTPHSMWAIESEDPILWSLRREKSLDIRALEEFGQCVHKQRNDSPNPRLSSADSDRGVKSAAIIQDRIARQLLDHGCAGTGPDSCLALLPALQALKPNHPDMVAIIRRLDMQTNATKPETIPAQLTALKKDTRDRLNPLVAETLQKQWRKGIVLSAKVQHMMAYPQLWQPLEIQNGVDATIAMMLVRRQMNFIEFPYGSGRRAETFTDPWLHLQVNRKTPAVVAARLQKLGAQAGEQSGCEVGKLATKEQPPEYWYAYAQTKLQREKKECGALPMDWVAKQYMLASVQRKRTLLAPISQMRDWVSETENPTLRDTFLRRIETDCPAANWGADYWGICSRHAALVDAQNKIEIAKREQQERKEHAVQNNPCTNGTVKALAVPFGYQDDEGTPINHSRTSCKQLPDSPTNAAIAFFHLTHPLDPNNPDYDDGDYDLHLIVANNKGDILAQFREKNAATSDAVRLDSIDIDTGRYTLKPKVRAFGVSTYNAAHCYQCAFYERKLSLFVPLGNQLQKVWSGLVASSESGADSPEAGCTNSINEMRKVFSVGQNTHAGYADLVITTIESSLPGFNPENEKQVCLGESSKKRIVETWIYDGKQYRLSNPQGKNTIR